jgi:type VI secretion system protein ImpL
MKKIFGFFISRWFLSFVAVAVVSALVWFFGPFLAALAGVIARAAIILVLLLVWLGVNLLLDWRRRKRDNQLAAGVAAVTPADAAAAGEVAALGEKLKTSLAVAQGARDQGICV